MERVADYIVRKVNEAGADHIFLITGRGILYLTDAVAKNDKITPISTYHEQGASYAAMAYSRVSGNVSACMVSTGCAATNAVTACLCAYQDNLPVIFISGNNPLNENTRHTGSIIRTYGAQEADIINIVKSVTKYAIMLENKEDVVYEVEKALFFAQEGRKGPVWIDVPLDVQNMRIKENELKHYVPVEKETQDIMNMAQGVANELNVAQRPVILVGGGAKEAKETIKVLAEKYRIPVVCSPSACDIYGTGNELCIGTVSSLGGSRAGNFVVQNSDYVLAVASKLCSQLTGVKDKFARNAKVVVIDIDQAEHTKDGVVDAVINCDARVFLINLLECRLIVHDEEWTEKCFHWKNRFAVKNESFIQELKQKNEIDLYSMMDQISDILPDDATVITDAGFEELIVPSTVRYRDKQRCLFPAAQGAMGYAIPAIIGAYEAGKRNIICIVGDGSIMMNMQELQIIASLHIPVKILVVNNEMYAVIRKRQTDLFRNRRIGNDPHDGVPKPDFKKIAACFSIAYRLIENRSMLLENLPFQFSDKPEIIEVVCTPDQKYFHESYTINMRRKLVRRPIEDMSPFLPREVIGEEMVVKMMEE